MFGLRFTIDAHARSKNGHPAQNTTGVDRARPIPLINGTPRHRHPAAGGHVEHRHDKYRQAQENRDPEPAGHVGQLRVGSVGQRQGTRFQRHAADRARAWTISDDLRVHRTREGGSWWRLGGAAGGVRGQEHRRVALELFDTARIAEVVRHALVLDRAGRVLFFDGHPAHGIGMGHTGSNGTSLKSQVSSLIRSDFRF